MRDNNLLPPQVSHIPTFEAKANPDVRTEEEAHPAQGELNPIDMAWAGGLFDGEGYITVHKAKRPKKTHKYVNLGLRMTDRDAVERFNAVFPGNLGSYPGREHEKLVHRWTLSGKKALPVLQALLPYLCQRRRERAAEVLEEVYS